MIFCFLMLIETLPLLILREDKNVNMFCFAWFFLSKNGYNLSALFQNHPTRDVVQGSSRDFSKLWGILGPNCGSLASVGRIETRASERLVIGVYLRF